MDHITQLEDIRSLLDGVISQMKADKGDSTEWREIVVLDSLPQFRNDAILAVLEANYDLLRPGIPVGAMRNKEILETLNKAGRDDRASDVDFYLSNLRKNRRVERVDTGLYRALRRPDSGAGS